MLIGYFDYLIIAILIFLNIRYWKSNFEEKIGCLLVAFLFGLVLPFVSMIVELQIVGEWMDSFEVVYTFLRFPTYWIIGIIQMVIIGIRLSRKPDEENEIEKIDMNKTKRLNFLKSFLKLYGVEKIKLTNVTSDSISGIAIYDENDPEERQDFIWHKSEDQVPSPELIILIEKIVAEKWHNGDKISEHIEELEFEEFDNSTKNKILTELFDVEIRMVDDGKETDTYWVHY